jgi:Na+/H+ antiporter NhaD/arsenite permease-like protein
MLYSIVLFVLTCVLMLAFDRYRPIIALVSAAIFVFTGMLPMECAFSYVDWNVLMMIAGTMGTVALLIESKMPALIADLILEKVPNVKWAIVTLSLFAGIVSAFIDNVATVLMIAPIALAIAKKLDISPVGMIIAIAVSSNLQGAATLVGDTTSILLGGYAGMNFLDFFIYHGKPGIFFAVELGALFSAFIDNIPYVATMLPVTRGIATAMGVDPTLLYFGLLSGATLGGNLTPVGASANITGIGILRKAGYTVKNSDFLRIGIPFTFAAIIPAYLYFWILYR